MKREQGFTMIELMITIVILCILLGLAIPGFSRWLPNYRLRGAARDLYSNLQLAKIGGHKGEGGMWRSAFRRGQQPMRSGVVNSGPNRTWESTSGSVGGDDVILKTVIFPNMAAEWNYGAGSATSAVPEAGVDNNVTFPATAIVFNSRGMVTTTTGAVSRALHVYRKTTKTTLCCRNLGVRGDDP